MTPCRLSLKKKKATRVWCWGRVKRRRGCVVLRLWLQPVWTSYVGVSATPATFWSLEGWREREKSRRESKYVAPSNVDVGKRLRGVSTTNKKCNVSNFKGPKCPSVLTLGQSHQVISFNTKQEAAEVKSEPFSEEFACVLGPDLRFRPGPSVLHSSGWSNFSKRVQIKCQFIEGGMNCLAER